MDEMSAKGGGCGGGSGSKAPLFFSPFTYCIFFYSFLQCIRTPHRVESRVDALHARHSPLVTRHADYKSKAVVPSHLRSTYAPGKRGSKYSVIEGSHSHFSLPPYINQVPVFSHTHSLLFPAHQKREKPFVFLSCPSFRFNSGRAGKEDPAWLLFRRLFSLLGTCRVPLFLFVRRASSLFSRQSLSLSRLASRPPASKALFVSRVSRPFHYSLPLLARLDLERSLPARPIDQNDQIDVLQELIKQISIESSSP